MLPLASGSAFPTDSVLVQGIASRGDVQRGRAHGLEQQHCLAAWATRTSAVIWSCFIAMRLLSDGCFLCLSDYARISSFQEKTAFLALAAAELSFKMSSAKGCEVWSPLLSNWEGNEELYTDYPDFL